MELLTEEARLLAEGQILNDPSDREIVEAVCEIRGITPLESNMLGWHMIVATYNKYDRMGL